MASFVSVKDFNKVKEKIAELEARVQALEGFEAAAHEPAKPEIEPAPIPTIQEAVENPVSLLDLDDKTVDLLVDGGYPTIYSVRLASDEQLQAINGIGAATVQRIRTALE